jgi:hypothetical protein
LAIHKRLPRFIAMANWKLAQDRANRSKKDKVIYRQIDIFEAACC